MATSVVHMQNRYDSRSWIGAKTVSMNRSPQLQRLLLTDVAGRIQHVEPAIAQHLGRPMEEVLGRSIGDFVEQAEAALLQRILNSFHSSGAARSQTQIESAESSLPLFLKVKVGKAEPMRLSVRPLRNERGEMIGLEWGPLVEEAPRSYSTTDASLEDILNRRRPLAWMQQPAGTAPERPERPATSRQLLTELGHDLLVAKSMTDVLQVTLDHLAANFEDTRLMLQVRPTVDVSLIRLSKRRGDQSFPESVLALPQVQEALSAAEKDAQVVQLQIPYRTGTGTSQEPAGAPSNLLVAPVRHEEEVQGVLLALRPGKRPFHLDEMELITQMLDLSATAISGAAVRLIAEERATQMSEYAETLLKANAELQRFAYVASHDLKESVRMVTSYIELLKRRYADRLDPDAQTFIGFALEGAQRLDELIDDLRSYTQADPSTRQFTRVDANAALERAVVLLRREILETDARVQVDPLPVVRSNDYLLTQLFFELLENGLKFRGKGRPRIHILAEEKDDHWLFAMADRGIGIDPAHHEDIFEMFRRLHPRDRYPGGGMGLAIAKKIVEWHGGRIWVDSMPGHGATFYFTLPKA